VYTFGKKMTSVAAADKLLCIGHGRRLVETCSKSFADHDSRGGVIAASTIVNFMEQLNTCFSSDTLH
jgi:hypothetical protein